MKDAILQNVVPSLNDYYLLQKQVEIMIEANNKRLANDLINMNNMINKLNEEILEIKKHLTSQNRPQQKAEIIILDKESTQHGQKTVKTEPISKPRYGDYKPEDVAVDKFFYFGNKK